MITILSTNVDLTTDKVIDWLSFYNKKYIRVNDNDFSDGRLKIDIELSDNNHKIELSSADKVNEVDIEDLTVVWYRKFGFYNNTLLSSQLKPYINSEINNHLVSEYHTNLAIFSTLLEDKEWLCKPTKIRKNKIKVLSMAKKVGLKIPKSKIVNNKKSLKYFIIENEDYITKPLERAMHFNIKDEFLNLSTLLINESDFDKIPDSFFPSLVQSRINKDYELRVFYLDGVCYSMAIFSQNDEQTQVDYRNYNKDKPNRIVPYNLPDDISHKLDKLMKNMGLNTGSIDIIKSTSGEYIFLEVNPSGQFGMVSHPCNFYLEEKVANFLISKDERE